MKGYLIHQQQGGSMSPEPGGEWTQETNSSSRLVIEDALIRWAGACWRVITKVSFSRLLGDDQPLYLCILIVWPAPHPSATSPAAHWSTELCLCWHLLNSHGLLQIPLHLSVSVCVCICVCMCAEGEQRDIIASPGEGGKSYSTGAPTVAKPFPIMSSFCNNNCV